MNFRSLILGFLAALGFVCSVHAHHGWGGYDTGRPLYLEGTVTKVHWRNPHPELVIEVAATPPRADPANVPVPPELESIGFRDVLAKAQAPEHGGRYTLDLAPIGRLANWGMSAAPRRGERIIAVAFPSCSEAGSVRPAVIVLANGGAVRQQSVDLPAGCSGAPRG
ncbi:hypothetical protein N181_22320 [Sinorhizobium fredii USDA 205]|uniref:DUF6152 family protein n=1 Tax=Rhizobium fredii TaxID=380 RepID=UPI0006859777|nr:DUF6152 family protein [Sinorhizobium fredii]KSV86215.1 hypothetical protein N181_22320 [Sinorhizobium fredii USDA 205]GEC33709.1 hypothetical protein EFR01_38800 [Sinorhizobium fredii]GLS06758.1 hypothetical protein GCM10007864_03830 [Sinorhizobium fredii]